ncbi:N-acetylmuramoyl-L-alanine amidase [Roseofilum capinflatum]|uniref:N-acetylmuramoyl-L-alanine amidase n=1 Tax=Roseofilum capinflatum BLCC-M114 TaxID=3022440 RepID=A0ABT7B9R4_9CYAN|nr:N-acetylmuramoyl-L-alanine amidase [Roseofilum capinflatum]MDJ1175028.1 N-acetylmuramoyl-L-alanine amidase [Roseofilum capinflatum BLCC-M114]
MKFALSSLLVLSTVAIAAAPAVANSDIFIAYPGDRHQTTADRIFLIGTAPVGGEVRVNGEVISRSPGGHFAPSFPLEMGENTFTLRHGNQEKQITIIRNSALPPAPVGVNFAEGSLTPSVNIAKPPGEQVCFSAIAPNQATVTVTLGQQTLPLTPQSSLPELPPNSAVLTGENQPTTLESTTYKGCATLPLTSEAQTLGKPQFTLSLNGQTLTQAAPGEISILSPVEFQIAEVTAENGVARTGPSTNYSRLTPLPKGTRAQITAEEGEWLRLDYGAWIKREETRIFSSAAPPISRIRSIRGRQTSGWTEVVFPLQVPVPVSIQQRPNSITLSLYNTTAQTDTIYLNDGPLIKRLDWEQVSPTRIDYTFALKTEQQWGYKLRYEGTTLILSLRHPPQASGSSSQPLQGMRILLDPGHGSENDLGARGPNGYPEKDVNLVVSKLLRDELRQRGATVLMTREGDDDLWPHDRVEIIEAQEPDLALSIHYNALPDAGDAENTAGIGMFWYHPQAHSLAVFLHQYLVEELNRPSYGVFWNNLALARPAIAPSVLLELGFMINPWEFEWIVDPQSQQELAETLADGIVVWVHQSQQ